MLWQVCNRRDLAKEWLFERCKEVEANPDGYIDLWSREHYKSTIITFGKTIQDILNNPNITIGIFSHTRPIAKAFLRQIKLEFEGNKALIGLFPNILWESPHKDAPKWSEDDGLIVQRTDNKKEATIEAWGVVDGQPTGKHFDLLIYDDLVTKENVTTPEMIVKTTDALALSYNLGAHGGRRRFVGTRYHFNDTWKEVIARGSAIPRIYPATVDGTPDGEPVLIEREALQQKRRDMGPYVFACQMLLNPVADESQGFKVEWLRYYDASPETIMRGANIYILVDAANEKRKHNDYTAVWVLALRPDHNFYVLRIIRDRLNLTERGKLVMDLHRTYGKRVKQVRYEKYGLMADVAHIKHMQASEAYSFDIKEVGGQTPKNDRIKRLIPLFEQNRFYFPRSLHYTNYEKKTSDLVYDFINEELKAFPVPAHDDMLDALARIEEPDLPLVWPKDGGDKAELLSLANKYAIHASYS